MNSNEASPKAEDSAIFVLGMHRSGTSATTRVLNLLGAELGTDLLEAQADNAKGFWEHARAVQIHEELFAALGYTWHDVREMPEGWLEHPATYAAVDQIVRLIHEDFQGRALWAVKDPRMCRLLPIWIRALERVGVRPTALIVMRKPEEVAGSLHAREGWVEAHSDLMWTQYSLEAIRHTCDMPRLITSYDELLADWRGTVDRIGKDLGIQWPKLNEETSIQIDSFLAPEDRHHHAADEISTATAVSLTVPQKLYALCLDVAAGRADWPQLAQFDASYLESAHLFRDVTEQKHELDRIALERINHIHLLERELQSAASLAAERGNHLQLLAAQHQEIINVAMQRQAHIEQLERTVSEHGAQLQAMSDLAAELSAKQGQQAETNEALSKRCLELDDALRHEQEIEAAAFADLNQLRDHCERLSKTVDLTFSRRWLARRFWEITTKRNVLPTHLE